MPKTKKPAGTAVDSRNGRRAELVIPAGTTLEPFDLPKRTPVWLATSREAWSGAWLDPIHQAWTLGDRPILLRWIDALDRATRLLQRADRSPTTKGSMGQLVEHPFYGTAARAVAIAEKCEQQLGFGALNREKLGFTIAAARKSLEELNRELDEGPDDDDPR